LSTRINIGPVHPSTHGVLRLLVDIDGDRVESVEPHVGLLHRGVEKLVENRAYMQNMPYMEKLDYVAPLSYAEAYVSAVEHALGIEVKARAVYVRTVLLELQRIASHLLWLGVMANDLGQFYTVFMWAFRDRDKVLRLMEETSGARMFHVSMRLGGLQHDLPKGFEDRCHELLTYLEKQVDKYRNFLEKNSVFVERMQGVGLLDKERAIALGVTGPVLRASGVNYDVRSNNPYYAYDALGFEPQVRSGGDCLTRYDVRMMEIEESIRIVREALNALPEGSALGMPIRFALQAVQERVSVVKREMPRGECMMYLVADPQQPYRLHVRSPSFANLSALSEIAKGCKTADLFAILGSLDIVMGEVDR